MLTIRASVFGHLMNTEINLTVEPVCAISERLFKIALSEALLMQRSAHTFTHTQSYGRENPHFTELSGGFSRFRVHSGKLRSVRHEPTNAGMLCGVLYVNIIRL